MLGPKIFFSTATSTCSLSFKRRGSRAAARSTGFYAGVWLTAMLLCLSTGCYPSAPPDEARKRQLLSDDANLSLAEYAAKTYPPEDQDLFKDMDGKRIKGKYTPLDLSESEVIGRNAWMIWTGGNEAFWDWLARNGYGTIDLLKLLDDRNRGTQFATAGLITEPGMREPTAAETKAAHGIRFARPIHADYSAYSGSLYSDYGQDAYPASQPVSTDATSSQGNVSPTDAKKPESNKASAEYPHGDGLGPYGNHRPPDPYVYGYSSGIVGLRLFPNPEFTPVEATRFDSERYYNDSAYSSNPSTIRPFRVGMACSFCHVGPHPLNPPVSAESPKWENLSSTTGAQYMRVREVFGGELEPDNYFYHVLDSQMPGTIDTSLIPADNINNANSMNAIFRLGARVLRAKHNPAEQLTADSEVFPGLWQGEYPADLPKEIRDNKEAYESNPRDVPRVLIDGSDSVGSWIALARVYLNIGSYHQRWIQSQNTILGFRDQSPFKLADCEANSVYWHATKLRVDPMTAFFLKSSDAMRLKDAPDGIKLGWKHLSKTEENFHGNPTDAGLYQGRQAFARGCIACHSSIQPGTSGIFESTIESIGLPEDRSLMTLSRDDLASLTRGDGKLPKLYQQWAYEAVKQPEFWEDNFLSTDLRIPVTLTGTNSARAMATNAMHDELWEDFASLTYKELEAVGEISFRDPFSKSERHFTAPGGGPGYYRVPTLVSAWATAPFLHNNSLGNFNNDPSVEGRLKAFDDGITKLLTPSKRLEGHDHATPRKRDDVSGKQLTEDGGLIWRTSATSYIVIRGHQVPSFLAGFTGWRPIWVHYVIPWAPSLLLIGLGLLWMGTPWLDTLREWLNKRFPRSSEAIWPIRWLLAVGLIAASVIIAWLVWQYRDMLALVEISSGWMFPWIRLQALVPSFVLFALGTLLVFDALPLKSVILKWSGLGGFACFIVAVFVALGAGRSLSGNGGDIRIGPLPKGVPVNLIANMNPNATRTQQLAAVRSLSQYLSLWHTSPPADRPGLEEFERTVAPALQAASKCPDLVLDRGHDYEFMQHFTEDEKAGLANLIKTF